MAFLQDYLLFIGVILVVAIIRVGVYHYTTPLTEYGNKKIDDKAKDFIPKNVVQKIEETYNLKIKPNQEKSVKIKEMYLYPIRGVLGIKVNWVEITPFGLKQDRNWVIISTKKMKTRQNENSEIITFLRQEFLDEERTKLRIFFQDDKCFPELKKREHVLDFNKEYTNKEFVECADNYRGYKESDEMNMWLSEIFDEEMFIMRAPQDRVMPVNQDLPDKLKSDRRGNYVTDAAIHVLNIQSVESLRMVMYNKYQNDEKMLHQINAEVCIFRPSFVINEVGDEAYCEDEYQELRIGNIMFRQIGPCIRCKTITLNWKTNQRHPENEPYATVLQVRKHHKMGPIFGIYLQPEMIPTKEDFKKLLPGYPEVTDRSFGTEGIVKTGDAFKLRVRKRTYYLQ